MKKRQELSIVERLENFYRNLRTKAFSPILFLLTKLNVNADQLTFLGLIFSLIMFYFLITNKIILALIFFFIVVTFDSFDGSLARYQKKLSDKGKFLDFSADTIKIILILLGLIYLNVIDRTNGAFFIFITLSVAILSIFLVSIDHKTDWYFYSRAGLPAQLPRGLLQLFFILWALGILNILNIVIIIGNIYLVIEGILYYRKIIQLPPRK